MEIIDFEKILKAINFDAYFVEATFQFKLLMKLTNIMDENCIFPERNIGYYKLNPENYIKREIDIVLENENNSNVAIELKMPMNGQVPEQMYSFVKDIKFLEELKASNVFKECYLLTITNDSNFWKGRKNDSIYPFFRGNDENKLITGKIFKPTGENRQSEFYMIKGQYKIEWKKLNELFKYFIIRI